MHKHTCAHIQLSAIPVCALSLSNINSREPGATSRATAKKSCAKKSYGVTHRVILVSLVWELSCFYFIVFLVHLYIVN